MSTPALQLPLAEVDAGGRRYDRHGLLAIDPQAFFMLFAAPAIRENEVRDNVEIVDVRGPLDQHTSSWCDSYEAILARVGAACEGGAGAIVLRVDSPGGEATGVFEAARALRATCARAQKPLYAFVEGKACSAAYALASAASKVFVAQTAQVGSIGVISTRPDYTAQNAMRGLAVAMVTSGSRKTDGHPDYPITEAELSATQVMVDALASVFFELVADMRATAPETIAALDAKVFCGAAAIAAGLADFVQPFDQMLALIASPGGAQVMAATAYEKAKAALEEAAKIDDANGKAAKRALAALGEQPGEEEPKPEDDEAAAEDEEEPTAEAPAEEPKPGAAAPDASVSAATAAAVATSHTTLAARLAKLEAKGETDERTALLASRSDLDADLVKVLAKRPLADVKAIVSAIKRTTPKPAATAAVTGTRGDGQGDGEAARLPPAEKARLDAAMGITRFDAGVVHDGNRLLLGAPVPAAQAAASPSATPPAKTPPAK